MLMGFIDDLYSDDNVISVTGVILREGVWNGIYVPADVLDSAATSLLGKYVMLGHPAADTEPNWPEQALGQVVRVDYVPETGELRADMILWKSRVPEDLLNRLASGEVIPVSSGHLSYDDDETGTVGDRQYTKRTKKLYFEHVGIVSAGACDVSDGCGVFVERPQPEAELDVAPEPVAPVTTAEPQPAGFAGTTGSMWSKTTSRVCMNKSISQEGESMEERSEVTRTLFMYPFVDSASGSIDWKMTDSQEDAVARTTEVYGGLINERNAAKIEAEKLKGDLDKLTGEVNVVRETLVGELRQLMPNAPDDVIGRYAVMDVTKLRELVTDLKTYVSTASVAPTAQDSVEVAQVQAEAAPEGGRSGGEQVSEAERTLNSSAPTRVAIQTVCSRKSVSLKDAMARLRQETGIKKFVMR